MECPRAAPEAKRVESEALRGDGLGWLTEGGRKRGNF